MTDEHGTAIRVGARVQVHPAHTLFMRGLRWATVTKVGRKWVTVTNEGFTPATHRIDPLSLIVEDLTA